LVTYYIQFISTYVKENRNQFADDVDVGLLTDDETSSYSRSQMETNLSFEERQYISGKLFGFKMFPMNFGNLFALAHYNESDETHDKLDFIKKFITENFSQNTNILIVLRPGEAKYEDDVADISKTLHAVGVNIGFMEYMHDIKPSHEYFSKIPVTSAMIKATCLLDAVRPDAISLKHFSYKYGLEQHLDKIRMLHFMTRNSRYDVVFKHLFPSIKLHSKDIDENDHNIKAVMEMIKNMFTAKNDIEYK
jgi:hypothetical protein